MSHRGKVLVLVMDGLGDRAIKDLDFRTPLQAARRPNMNWYVKHGSSGIMDVIAPGVRPGSDTSHLAILGYDPFEVYTGGINIFRLNTSTIPATYIQINDWSEWGAPTYTHADIQNLTFRSTIPPSGIPVLLPSIRQVIYVFLYGS